MVPACAADAKEGLDAHEAQRYAHVFKALGDPTRLRLVTMVAAHENQEACVCDLTEPLDLGQPTVSHHLKILVDAGILRRDKRGIWSYYSIVPGALQAVGDLLHTLPAAPG
nr:metalloregulator ArsR/SmtB family transcription factor [Microlunatus panaciterrae]